MKLRTASDSNTRFVVLNVIGCLPVDMDSGELAKWVSNASFATLTLIYSFTQLLDLANHFSTLLGVTLRVGQLLQVLPSNLLFAVCRLSRILTPITTGAISILMVTI